MTRKTERASAATMALAAPPLAFGALVILLLLGSLAGWRPLWPDQNLNLAEAASLRDRAAMIQSLRAGDNPNNTFDIREGLVLLTPVRMTPLEAAIWTRHEHVVEFLLAHGARVEGRRQELVCFARENQSEAIEALLAEPGATYDCTGVRSPLKTD